MVAGGSTKNKKSASVNVNYLIHIQEVKPWPPSQSLRSVKSVLIKWENGDRKGGSTNTVVPSLGPVIGEGKIEFNESFRLRSTLVRDVSSKGKDSNAFHKSCVEFNLYEPRRDKIQLLATAVIDLADYGVVKETISISTPMNSTRSFSNTSLPVLCLTIEPIELNQAGSSSKDAKGSESVSGPTGEDFVEEAEIASLTEDDVSSYSSVTYGSLPSQGEENEPERPIKCSLGANRTSNPEGGEYILAQENNISGCSYGSPDLSSDMETLHHDLIQKSEKADVAPDIIDEDDEVNCNYSEASFQERTAKTIHQNRDSIANLGEENQSDDGSVQAFALETAETNGSSGIDSKPYSRETETNVDTPNSERLKYVKSVRSSPTIGVIIRNQHNVVNENRSAKVYPNPTILDTKIHQLKQKIKLLEEELRDAAGIEAALYSVVAEHGSSISKVHAPARRLSRLYIHASRESSQSRKAGVARSSVSGLVTVAKACGNDVPRLTFWLSNSVMLRAMVTQAINDQTNMRIERKDSERHNKLSPSLKWKDSSSSRKESKELEDGDFDNWNDLNNFVSALERVEAWIFSRAVESIWWQALTPHMQSTVTKAMDEYKDSSSRKNLGRTSSSVDQDQGNFSLDLWKNAFKDACETLCPIRAAGHQCGCLPVLSRLVMEQCVARLDVAMFNAILRESADEVPTDPISDPISDPKVLPIPPGQSSFSAGAQLKNVIGNWSRWLTDLFGMDDDDMLNVEYNEEEENSEREDESFKSFILLKSLSNLMMLPKDMLFSRSIRNEVCPKFGESLIKRVLENFTVDEFCPDSVPEAVFEVLELKDAIEVTEDLITVIPCIAPAPIYLPPSADSIARGYFTTGDIRLSRNGSSLLRKSYTSDDELDELNSPLTSILQNGSQPLPASTGPNWISTETGNEHAIRYQLLRNIWAGSD